MSISETKVFLAIEAWGSQLIQISQAYEKSGIKEATTRARTALENDFISQGVANAVSRKCSEMYELYSSQIDELTMQKINDILGDEYFEKYKKEELDLE